MAKGERFSSYNTTITERNLTNAKGFLQKFKRKLWELLLHYYCWIVSLFLPSVALNREFTTYLPLLISVIQENIFSNSALCVSVFKKCQIPNWYKFSHLGKHLEAQIVWIMSNFISQPLSLFTSLLLLNGEKNPSGNPTHCPMCLTCSFTYQMQLLLFLAF